MSAPEHNACGTPDCCRQCPSSAVFMWLYVDKPAPRLRLEQCCCEPGCLRPARHLGRCTAHWQLGRLFGVPTEWL